ncbi:hypothetical protein D3C80_874950 [compost metagenome]
MVFVHVAHDHQFSGVELGADVVRNDGRVEGRTRVRATDEHLVTVGIFPALLAEEDRDTAEIETLDAFPQSGMGCCRNHGEFLPELAILL